MLRHARPPVAGQPVENTFFAIDERTGEQLGASVIYVDENPTLYPARPVQVRIHLENPDVPDALLGATIARAKEICAESEQLCRIYTRCEPDDDALLSARELLGCVMFGLEEDGEGIPEPTPLSAVALEPNERVVLVDVYMPAVRMAQNNKSVNRTVTLPAWLNAAALERNINFSQVLQDALKTQMGI